MSNFERSIVSLVDPTIKVDLTMMQDMESEKAKSEKVEGAPSGDDELKGSSRVGSMQPLIYINTTKFVETEILNFELSLDGPIPTLDLSVRDQDRKFDVSPPLDGDVINVYLRPPDSKNQKPIRIDFDILSIDPNAESLIYSFTGVMKVPGLFSETNKSFPENTSFEHLQDISEFLKVGFASNETTTDDKMIRICPYVSMRDFIDETVKHTYKDDDSFFTWYIDPYYYLTLVNLNKQFSTEDKTEEINLTNPTMQGQWKQGETPEGIKGSLVLTNKPTHTNYNTYIESLALKNNSAVIWQKEGYKRYAQYYNVGDGDAGNEYVSNFVDPLTTKGSEDKFILAKGRPDEKWYKDQNKYKWLGKQSSLIEKGNVHDNYLFSEVLNHQNLQEINKLSLTVSLKYVNMYIYKYMRIPVLIYQDATNRENFETLKRRDKDLGEDKENNPNSKGEPGAGGDFARDTSTGGTPATKPGDDQRDSVKNEFLSGYYVVSGIRYKWTAPGPIKMYLTLVRREWPIPAKNSNA